MCRPSPHANLPAAGGLAQVFLRGIQEVSQSATVTARAISNLRENHRQLIADKLGGRASLGLPLLDYLFQQPMISGSLVEKRLDCSFVTANRIVEQLAELALLREITGWQRNRRYRYHPYLALFEALAVPERTQESNSSDESSPTRRQPAM